MQLISEQYREENRRQHQQKSGYGVGGHKHAQDVQHFAAQLKAETVLDYGCGQATLAQQLRRISPVKVFSYDPAVEEYSVLPDPADLVVCTDVLEHVEPTCLFDVMTHMQQLALKGFYFQISTRPAKRILSDGRNAHILLQPPYFWFDTVRQYFDITNFKVLEGHSVAIVGKALGDAYK